FKLGHGDKFTLEVLRLHFAVFDEHIRAAFDDLVESAVAVEEADDQIVHGQQGGGADDAAEDGVVVANDRVLDGVGQSKENDQIERVELGQFAFAGETQTDDEKNVNDYRTDDLFGDGQAQDKHVPPKFVHARRLLGKDIAASGA